MGDDCAPNFDNRSKHLYSSGIKRVAMEKAAALQRSTLAVVSGRNARAVLAPWHRIATANVKRRKKR
jgi:hypothetical protein